MKKITILMVFSICFYATIINAQTKSIQKKKVVNTEKTDSMEIVINKKYDEIHLLKFNFSTVTISVQGNGNSTLHLIVNSQGISDVKYEIKLGMTVDQVNKYGKLMGIKFDKKTKKYWLVGDLLMKFQNNKLVQLPGICDPY